LIPFSPLRGTRPFAHHWSNPATFVVEPGDLRRGGMLSQDQHHVGETVFVERLRVVEKRLPLLARRHCLDLSGEGRLHCFGLRLASSGSTLALSFGHRLASL